MRSSPRNFNWLKTHPWFETNVVPELRRQVAAALDVTCAGTITNGASLSDAVWEGEAPSEPQTPRDASLWPHGSDGASPSHFLAKDYNLVELDLPRQFEMQLR